MYHPLWFYSVLESGTTSQIYIKETTLLRITKFAHCLFSKMRPFSSLLRPLLPQTDLGCCRTSCSVRDTRHLCCRFSLPLRSLLFIKHLAMPCHIPSHGTYNVFCYLVPTQKIHGLNTGRGEGRGISSDAVFCCFSKFKLPSLSLNAFILWA